MNRSIIMHSVLLSILALIIYTACCLEPQWVQPLSPLKMGTVEKDVTYCNIDGLYLKMDIYS